MDVLDRLNWSIENPSLDSPGVSHYGFPITGEILDRFHQRIPLRTSNLILQLQPSKYPYKYEIVEFPTGPIVTPIQVLGAIHTYYSLPVSEDELEKLRDTEPEMLDIVEDALKNIKNNHVVPRSALMEDEIFLEELEGNPDGSFTVILED